MEETKIAKKIAWRQPNGKKGERKTSKKMGRGSNAGHQRQTIINWKEKKNKNMEETEKVKKQVYQKNKDLK